MYNTDLLGLIICPPFPLLNLKNPRPNRPTFGLNLRMRYKTHPFALLLTNNPCYHSSNQTSKGSTIRSSRNITCICKNSNIKCLCRRF